MGPYIPDDVLGFHTGTTPTPVCAVGAVVRTLPTLVCDVVGRTRLGSFSPYLHLDVVGSVAPPSG